MINLLVVNEALPGRNSHLIRAQAVPKLSARSAVWHLVEADGEAIRPALLLHVQLHLETVVVGPKS